jgi:hypothetical protein
VSTTTTTTTAIPVAPFITATTTTATQQITNTLGREDNIDLLASARARLGTLVWGNTLIYGTGGLAWTRFVSTRSQTQNIFGQAGTTAVSVVTSSGTGVGTSFGWVAGVGGETKLYNSNWLFRVEYLHYDFGDQGGFNGTGITRSVDGTSVTTSSSSLTNGHLTADVVRAAHPFVGERVLRAMPDADAATIVAAMPAEHATRWRDRLAATAWVRRHEHAILVSSSLVLAATSSSRGRRA